MAPVAIRPGGANPIGIGDIIPTPPAIDAAMEACIACCCIITPGITFMAPMLTSGFCIANVLFAILIIWPGNVALVYTIFSFSYTYSNCKGFDNVIGTNEVGTATSQHLQKRAPGQHDPHPRRSASQELVNVAGHNHLETTSQKLRGGGSIVIMLLGAV